MEFSPLTTRADSIHDDGTLIDRYGRHINYLRLSVTDRCDLRCHYCMPYNMKFLPKKEILTLQELLIISETFVDLGVKKIRITGGEPLVRNNVLWLCEKIAALDGLNELTITSNGTQLKRFATDLVNAGVKRINISLDTLQADKFEKLTRTGRLHDVLEGLNAAIAAKFPKRIKINTVMMNNFNSDEIINLVSFAIERDLDISFIEEMPLGDVGYERRDSFYSAEKAMQQLQTVFKLSQSNHDSGGPARYWDIADTDTRVGFITPHSHNFCHRCNRVRTTATGMLYPCLGQNDAVNIRDIIRESANPRVALRQGIIDLMDIKPKGHEFDLEQSNVAVVRFMSTTGG